jgi:hypothetical protein
MTTKSTLASLNFAITASPSIRVIAHALILRAQVNIEMLLGDVDPSVRTLIAIRYPTLRMHVHD